MQKLWLDDAWNDYLTWQKQDRRTLKRIHQLLQSIERNGFNCLGKPEPLRHGYAGWWSVRIDATNRLVFKIEDGILKIAACRGHYE